MGGVLLVRGRLRGGLAVALGPRRPNGLGAFGAAAKSSISLLSTIPGPGAVMPEPKSVFTV